MLRNSTAKLLNQERSGWGTAWALSQQLLVTAAHCLSTGNVGEIVSLRFPEREATGRVLWSNDTLDASLIRMTNAGVETPSAIPLARLSDVSRGELSWLTFGYPQAYDEGLTIAGTVTSCDGRLRGERVIELNCFQGVDSSALDGMSGGAVAVNGSCIGIIVFAPPGLLQKVVFAVPIESIAQSALESGQLSEPDDIAALGTIPTLQTDSFGVTLSQYLETVRQSFTRIPRSAMWLAPGKRRSHLSSSDVLVPLSYRPVIGERDEHATPMRGVRCEIASELNYSTFSIDSAVRQAVATSLRHIFFFGDPGSGKSFLLRHLASKAWDEPTSVGLDRPYIPVLVRLKNLSEKATETEDWLWEAMCRGSDVRPSRRPPLGFMDEWTRRSGAPWLFLLDGFDEIPTKFRLSMLDQVGLLLDDKRYLCFLTSRPAQGASDPVLLLCNTCTCYEIQPLTSEQERMLAVKWLSSEAPRFMTAFKRMRLNARRITPLLITIATGVFETYGTLPENRIGLYESLLNACVEGAQRRGLNDEIGPRLATLVRPLLETLALSCVEDRSARGYVSMLNDFRGFVKKTLRVSKEEASEEGSRALMALGRFSGLFFCDSQHFSWWHPTIQEYLAACLLARTSSDDRLREICLKWRDEAWSGVVFFLFTLMAQGGEQERAHIKSVSTQLAYAVIQDEQLRQTGLPNLPDESGASLETFGGAGLFLSAALAEGASFDSNLIVLLINYLEDSCKHAGKYDFCREVYEQLSNSGRSPVELLGQLTSYPLARAALVEILEDNDLQHWVHESAASACERAGMREELHDLLMSGALNSGTRALIHSLLGPTEEAQQ